MPRSLRPGGPLVYYLSASVQRESRYGYWDGLDRYSQTKNMSFVLTNAKIIGGRISEGASWEGDVLVITSVVVALGVTLTIQPGTRVMFKNYRGYREPEKRLSMVFLGSIISEGTADQLVYFTSDALDPQTRRMGIGL